jgi:hypothetical protein
MIVGESGMKAKRFPFITLSLAVAIIALSTIARAGPRIHIEAVTILASHDSSPRDRRLSGLINELESVFRYSSYRQISHDKMNLAIGDTGVVPLPGRRQLKITPIRVSGKRAELRVVIFKRGQQVFQTVIQLLNGGRMTVGGPKHKKGYLLFNISSSF